MQGARGDNARLDAAGNPGAADPRADASAHRTSGASASHLQACFRQWLCPLCASKHLDGTRAYPRSTNLNQAANWVCTGIRSAVAPVALPVHPPKCKPESGCKLEEEAKLNLVIINYAVKFEFAPRVVVKWPTFQTCLGFGDSISCEPKPLAVRHVPRKPVFHRTKPSCVANRCATVTAMALKRNWRLEKS